MGAGFLQDLTNQSATQNATQQNIMPTYQSGGVATTQGQNFNQTTNVAPYWGEYTAPVNINASNTAPTTKAPENTYKGSGGQVYFDPVKGQYYTQNNTGGYFGMGNTQKNYIGSSLKGSGNSGSSFDNPSPLPNYSMYIAPEHMPDINAYLQNPNSLLSALQSSGVPSSGAGRYSNLLSTNTSKGK
jgi:hypothetical protein